MISHEESEKYWIQFDSGDRLSHYSQYTLTVKFELRVKFQDISFFFFFRFHKISNYMVDKGLFLNFSH